MCTFDVFILNLFFKSTIFIYNNNNNNNSKSNCPVDHGLETDCWSHIHLSVDRDERSSSQFRSDVWSLHRVPCSCRLSRPELQLQISIYPNSSHWGLALTHIGQKILPIRDQASVTSHNTNSKQYDKLQNHGHNTII